MLVNNSFVDPMSIQVPRERQLDGKQLADFQKERARIDELMRRNPVVHQGGDGGRAAAAALQRVSAALAALHAAAFTGSPLTTSAAARAP